MSARPPRIYLGSVRSWGDRSRIYRTPEALEIDLTDHYEVRRRRVFFDEVQLVTLHETRAAGPLPWAYGLLGGVVSLPALIVGSDSPIVRNTLLAIAAVLVLAALVVSLAPVWVLNVFGRRTRAQVHFRFREGKARAAYADICRATGEAQRGGRFQGEAPASLPLSASEVPPLPPEEPGPAP